MIIENLESYRVYLEFIQKIDRLFDDIYSQYSDKMHCDKQCFECCKNLVSISFIEGLHLQEGIKNLDKQTLQAIRKNLQEIKSLDVKKLSEDQKPFCPLLINGICAVYDHRPVICRCFGAPLADDVTGEVRTCPKNFPDMREKDYTFRAISTRMLSTQTVLLTQYLLKETGKDISDDYIPPLTSIVEVLEYSTGENL
jgi:Fe-S-cluster containining protein